MSTIPTYTQGFCRITPNLLDGLDRQTRGLLLGLCSHDRQPIYDRQVALLDEATTSDNASSTFTYILAGHDCEAFRAIMGLCPIMSGKEPAEYDAFLVVFQGMSSLFPSSLLESGPPTLSSSARASSTNTIMGCWSLPASCPVHVHPCRDRSTCRYKHPGDADFCPVLCKHQYDCKGRDARLCKYTHEDQLGALNLRRDIHDRCLEALRYHPDRILDMTHTSADLRHRWSLDADDYINGSPDVDWAEFEAYVIRRRPEGSDGGGGGRGGGSSGQKRQRRSRCRSRSTERKNKPQQQGYYRHRSSSPAAFAAARGSPSTSSISSSISPRARVPSGRLQASAAAAAAAGPGQDDVSTTASGNHPALLHSSPPRIIRSSFHIEAAAAAAAAGGGGSGMPLLQAPIAQQQAPPPATAKALAAQSPMVVTPLAIPYVLPQDFSERDKWMIKYGYDVAMKQVVTSLAIQGPPQLMSIFAASEQQAQQKPSPHIWPTAAHHAMQQQQQQQQALQLPALHQNPEHAQQQQQQQQGAQPPTAAFNQPEVDEFIRSLIH